MSDDGGDENGDGEMELTDAQFEAYEDLEEETILNLLDEADAAQDRLLSVINDIDRKAGDVLRLNVLLFSLVLALASLSTNQGLGILPDFLNTAFYLGLIASGTSIFTSFMTYQRTEIKVGVSSRNIDTLTLESFKRKEILYSLLMSHKRWIDHNADANDRDSAFLFISLLGLLISMTYYMTALLFVAAPEFNSGAVKWVILAMAGLVPIAVTFLYQFREWSQVRELLSQISPQE